MLFGEFVALPSEKDRQVEEAGKAERTLRVTSARGTFPFAGFDSFEGENFTASCNSLEVILH